jgi:protein TonB
MPILGYAPIILALAVLSAAGQQPTSRAPEANAPVVPTEAAATPDKLMHIGGKIQKPVAIHMAEPQFSDEAKQAKQSGQVLVYLWVEKDGIPSHVSVVRPAGMGLDEKAVEAVRQYRFKPATLKGQPVTVDLYVLVNFQVLGK